MKEFFRRIRYLIHRRRFDEELAGEMEFHREMAARAGGMPLGNALHLREQARDAWGWTWVERLAQDLRYAARMLRKSPGFTAAAVAILAIGIGVNVAAFGFLNLLVLRPLPVRDPATLLRFQRFSPQAYASVLPYPEMAFFREHATTLSAVVAWSPASLTIDGEAKPVKAQFVTANYFSELGAAGSAGRLLDPSRDEAGGAPPVVVLSQGFWQRHFGADASVAGRTIRLNGKPVTVAGVAAAEFSGLSLDNPDLWLPVTQQPYLVNGSTMLTDYSVEHSGEEMWGRLKPGRTPQAAEQELRSLAAVLRASHPDDIWQNETLPSQPGGYATAAMSQSHHGTGTRDANMMVPAAAMIGALVLLILAVACGNLGGLLLARGVARQREISIRMAVGAGKGRLVRQLFTESLLLGLLGSLAGLGTGSVVLRTLLAASGTPPWLDASPDWRVTLFAVAMGFTAAILFGLTPAFQVVRQRHQASLVRQVLIGAQVAASCVLLIVAGLLVRALDRASGDPGFAYQQVLTVDPGLGNHAYSPAKASAYLDTLQQRLAELPGVDAVARASTPPFGNKTVTVGTRVAGRGISIRATSIDPQYFATMKLPLLRGRNLARGETHAVVISQSLAVLAWPTEDPIGKQLDVGDLKPTVVGICGNSRVSEDPDATQAYFPAEAQDQPSMVVLVRTAGRPEGMAGTVASLAKSIDPQVQPEVQLMKNNFQQRLHGAEYSILGVGVLAVVALLLACLGIVGLVAYSVSQRTKEIGIRMALGARPAQIVKIVLRQFSRPVAAGLLVGIGGAAGLAQVLHRVLFGIGSLDPAAYLGAIGLFALTVLVASVVPARRALRVDPVSALRND